MTKTAIKIVPTSNDTIVKFEADYFLTEHSSHEFENIDQAGNSPLAQQLFYLPFVKRVFIAQNFVAIDRYDIVSWADVQQEVADQIQEYLNNGGVVLSETKTTKTTKKVPVTVYAESTPNPEVLKFVTNKKIVLQAFEYEKHDDLTLAPLAKELFAFPFVKELFIDENYIAIAKIPSVEWLEITPDLREFIRAYLEAGNPVVTTGAQPLQHAKSSQNPVDVANLDPTSKEIIGILDEYVKPAVAGDGGNIMFDSYDAPSQTLKVVLQGACSGCPSSTVTLKNGIETMMREMLPGKVEFVEAVNG